MMTWKNYDAVAREGDLVQLLGRRHKSQFITLKAGAIFQPHRARSCTMILLVNPGAAGFPVTREVPSS